jgi:hypothetical protein
MPMLMLIPMPTLQKKTGVLRPAVNGIEKSTPVCSYQLLRIMSSITVPQV